MKVFDKKDLLKLYTPPKNSTGEDNGQITIIGGSKLFHGAPLLSLIAASKFVDMVFFASPDPSVGEVASKLKSRLSSFIWVPWEDVEHYIEKSDAILIGPGFMRYETESRDIKSSIKNKILNIRNPKLNMLDKAGKETYEITAHLLTKYRDKKWVIDAGSLQVMEANWIPKNAILTPNKKEFEMLCGNKQLTVGSKGNSQTANHMLQAASKMAKKYYCTIVLKGPETIVVSPDEVVIVKGGNAGLTKGGTGDTLAGLTVALLAKNDAFLAATSASYILKFTADKLFETVGVNYSADDLASSIPLYLKKLI
ncbi:NAD(P)H-hydrate dehydratase [Candidatus Woesebacteria bacterium]|nr:MAG: NAD(P)H-hydrate dehydratase [Candidatus Woesebacteria bacterium]